MEELINIMMEIKDLLAGLNNKFDVLTAGGVNGISDVVTAVNEIKGSVGYDLTDVCHKLDSIDSSLGTIDSSLSTIDSSLGTIDSSLGTIDLSLSTIDSSIMMKD